MPSGNEVTVSVSNQTPVTVTVPGSVGSSPTITNGGTANVAVTSVGDRGPQGDIGPATTLTIGTVTGGTTAAATLTGPAGAQVLGLTLPKGDKGDAGDQIQLQVGSTHIQWRYVGAAMWTNLVALSAITGPQGSTGATGSSIELQSNATHIQWRVAGGSTWTNLVALTAITGPQGATGATGSVGPAGPANSLSIGTITTGAAGSSASATITGSAPSQTLSLTIPRGDVGANIELQATSTHIQWRPVGGSTWTNLIALTAITGPQGSTGTSGTNGSNVELQTTSTHIQWRLVGGTTWTDLVALSAITGPQGPQGPATISIGTVTTLASTQSATVSNSGTSSAVVLDFGIPQGAGGTAGVSWQAVPMSPSASGTNGDIAYDASFLYVKSASGWRRTAIATWTPLGAPTSVSATAGNAQATVSWTAPVDNGGYAITDYAVQFSSNGGTSWTTFSDGTSTTTTATVTGLTNGTAYVFRVAAINGAGTGPYSSATSSVTPSSAPTDPNFSNVSLLLHMDGSGATFTDSSGTPKTITAYGNATQSAAQSKWGGKSAYFDGTGDYLSVGASTAFGFGTGDFTIEYWHYPVQNSGNETHIDTRDSDSGNWLVLGKSSGGAVRCYDGSSVRTGGSMDLNAWNHIAWVRSAGANTLYLNGTSVITFSNSGDAGSSRGLTIGSNVLTSAENTNGYIDDLRITKGVARYTANFTPPAAAFPDA